MMVRHLVQHSTVLDVRGMMSDISSAQGHGDRSLGLLLVGSSPEWRGRGGRLDGALLVVS